MNADVRLSPYQIGRTGFPLLWAPVFLRSEVGSGYFHVYPPLAGTYGHMAGLEAQGANVAAELRLRADHGARMTAMRPQFKPYRGGQRIRLDALGLLAAEPDREGAKVSERDPRRPETAPPQRTGESGAPVGRIPSAGMGRQGAGATGGRTRAHASMDRSAPA